MRSIAFDKEKREFCVDGKNVTQTSGQMSHGLYIAHNKNQYAFFFQREKKSATFERFIVKQ